MSSQHIQALNAIVDEIFSVLEEVRKMFQSWDSSYHQPFIKEVMRLQLLRESLHTLGYTEEFAEEVIRIVYHNVFTKDERLAYAGNWSIVV